MNRIERIAEMEGKLTGLLQVMEKLHIAADEYLSMLPDVQDLLEYSQSPQWMEDYEADASGELPEDMPRGVLSEDGISSMLEERESLCSLLRNILDSDG